MRAERRAAIVALATVAAAWSAPHARAYRLGKPWPQTTRNVQLAFTGTADSGRTWLSAAKEMTRVWKEIAGFTYVAVPGRETGCIEDAVSTAQFASRVCGLNYGPGVLAVTKSIDVGINGGPVRRTDSDTFFNVGPDIEGYAINYRWPTAARTVSNGITGASPSGTAYAAAFSQAASHWNDETAFALTVNAAAANPCDTDYATSAVHFAPTYCNVPYGPRVLAVTMSRARVVGGVAQATRADIAFNSAIAWDVYDGALGDTAIDFRRVAVHELGHLIGLDHSSMPNAIMWPAIHDGHATVCDDRRGVAVAYGRDPDEVCDPPGVRPTDYDWDIRRGALPFDQQAEFRRSIGAMLGFMAGLDDSDTADALVHRYISDIEYPTCDDQAGMRALYGNPAPCIDLSSVLYRDGFE
jgi:hypothetical protein